MSELIEQVFEKFNQKKAVCFVGKVKELNGDLCLVKRDGLPDLTDVRLHSISGELNNYFLVKPKIGSEVLCLEIEGKTGETCIVKYSEIEAVEMCVGGAEFSLSAGKFQFKNESLNIKDWLTEICQTMASAKAMTTNGPASLDPATIQKLNQSINTLNQLFE